LRVKTIVILYYKLSYTIIKKLYSIYMKKIKTIVILIFFFVFFIEGRSVFATEGDASWAITATGGNDSVYINDIQLDESGNSYVVGTISGTGTHDFGNGVTISGNNNQKNVFVAKFNSDGEAQWARSTTTAPAASSYGGLVLDDDGNIYAEGSITGNGTFDLGNSVTVSGNYASGPNALVVKYDSSGTTQWARSTTTAPASNSYSHITYSDGCVYTGGYLYTSGTFDFGNSVTVSGNYSTLNTLLVKYDSSGTTQWARSTTTAPNASLLYDLEAGSDGDIYAAGYIKGSGTYDFGNSITIAGNHTPNSNGLVIKYDSSGTTQWARSTTTAPGYSYFYGISLDSNNNIYVGGYLNGDGTYDFGNSVTVSGAYNGANIIVIKYNSGGTTQWARSTASATGGSYLMNITADTTGNAYAVGYATGDGTTGFGDDVSVNISNDAWDALIIKYDTDGTSQWAKNVTGDLANTDYSTFYGAAVDSSGNTYAVGEADGETTYNLGNSISITGTYAGANGLIVKYQGPEVDTPTPQSTLNSPVSTSEIQVQAMSSIISQNIIAEPIKDSDTGGQKILGIIQPGTIIFDAYLYANKVTKPSQIISLSNIPSNIVIGGIDAIIGIKSLFTTYWQVGSIQQMWLKTYPPAGHSAAIVIRELQEKPSIITFKYTDEHLKPIGRPSDRYNPKYFKIAHSIDGVNWKVLNNSVVDTINQTVAVIDEIGGYYVLVNK
jgi:hypothetical protein